MPFQTAVDGNIGFGIPGELYLEGPLRAQPGRLNTTAGTGAANNVFGRAMTVVSGATGTAVVGSGTDPAPMVVEAGGAGVFAGILANPKEHVSFGNSSDGPFGTSFVLPNGTIASCVQETAGIIVTLPAASSPGQSVFYRTVAPLGELVTAAANAAPPANTAGPIGKVERFVNAAASLAVISVFQPPRAPAAA